MCRDKTIAAMWVGILAVLGAVTSAWLPPQDRPAGVGISLCILGCCFLRAVQLGWIYGEIYERFRFVAQKTEPFSYWFYMCVWGFCGLGMLFVGVLVTSGWALSR